MRPLAVVDAEPGVGERLELRGRVEEMGVQHLSAIRAIEALDVRVLIRLARLDVVDHAPVRRPVDEGLRQKLGSVVPSES